MRFAILALLGIASIAETTNAIEIFAKPSHRANVQMETDTESDSDSDEENVQVQFDGFYPAHLAHTGLGSGYERVTTARFAADTDDIFMRSMIENYALEEKTCDEDGKNCVPSGGEPNGKFWMTKSTTLAAAKEVLGTHKGLSGKLLDDYVNTYFDKSWGHFDVNQTGYVEVIKMPQLMRFLCSDQS